MALVLHNAKSEPKHNSTFIFPETAQSDVAWLMENGPDGELTERTAKTGPYTYQFRTIDYWKNITYTGGTTA